MQMIGGQKDKLNKQIRFFGKKKKINIIYSNLFLFEEKNGKKIIFKRQTI